MQSEHALSIENSNRITGEVGRQPKSTARMKIINTDRFAESPFDASLARKMLNGYQR
jgi:hypothetical protein